MDAPTPRQFGGVEDCVEQAFSQGRPAHRALHADRRRQARRARQRLLPPRRRRSPHRTRDPDRPDARAAADLQASSSAGWSSRSRRRSSATRRNRPGSRRCARGGCRQTCACRNSSWSPAPGSTRRSRSSPTRASTTPTSRAACSRRRERVAQQIARRPGGRASLGTNPDVTADLIPMLRERDGRTARRRHRPGQRPHAVHVRRGGDARIRPSTSSWTTRAATTS